MLHLQEMAKQGQQNQTIVVEERLPAFVSGPCQLKAVYTVEAKGNYYLLHLETSGEITGVCQRCMQEFNYSYDNHTVIAACRNDERAEELLEHYECIVAPSWQVDLRELVVDELHLYAAQFHPEINDCDHVVNEILTGKIATY